MADEGHRNFVLSKLNKAFEHKVGPDDHIEDVRISRDVFKGTVKMLAYIVEGLENDYQKCGTGGIASAMQVSQFIFNINTSCMFMCSNALFGENSQRNRQ